MWLNHSKYCGFGEFSLFQKSSIFGDFEVDFGVVLGALGSFFVLWESFCDYFADQEADCKFHSKTGAREMRVMRSASPKN